MKTVHESDLPLLTRTEFRERCLERDQHRCVHCHRTDRPLNVHHILERRLFINGGYHEANGVSLCDERTGGCHTLAEQTLLSPDTLRGEAGVTLLVLPDSLYGDATYDKWGNTLHGNGRRSPGPLFWDASVQRILGEGGTLPLFDTRVKYPRTWHLPGSPGMQSDDRQLSSTDHWQGERLVITCKLDGQNLTLYHDGLHGRALNGHSHPSQSIARALQPALNLGPGVRLTVENLQAAHTLRYSGLTHHLYGLSFWEGQTCWTWDDTVLGLDVLGLPHPPVLYDGPYQGHAHLIELAEQITGEGHEGLVVRVARTFTLSEFGTALGKYVGKTFARHRDAGGHDWKRQAIIPNTLAGEGEAIGMTWTHAGTTTR